MKKTTEKIFSSSWWTAKPAFLLWTFDSENHIQAERQEKSELERILKLLRWNHFTGFVFGFTFPSWQFSLSLNFILEWSFKARVDFLLHRKSLKGLRRQRSRNDFCDLSQINSWLGEMICMQMYDRRVTSRRDNSLLIRINFGIRIHVSRKSF